MGQLLSIKALRNIHKLSSAYSGRMAKGLCYVYSFNTSDITDRTFNREGKSSTNLTDGAHGPHVTFIS